MDEASIVDHVQLDADGIPKFVHHVAIPAIEPWEVVIYDQKTKGQYRRPVCGFTAAGQPLVLDKQAASLTSVGAILKPGDTARIQTRNTRPFTAVGPFTQASTGMIAVFSDGRRLPVIYYDMHGRPVCIDEGERSRVLFALDEDDEELVRIECAPRIDTLHVADAPTSPQTDQQRPDPRCPVRAGTHLITGCALPEHGCRAARTIPATGDVAVAGVTVAVYWWEHG